MDQQDLSLHTVNGGGGSFHGVSITKTLTRLVSIPSNRSCADCKSPLVDALQVYASYSSLPLEDETITMEHYQQPHQSPPARQPRPSNSFLQNHAKFAPPGAAAGIHTPKNSSPPLHDNNSIPLTIKRRIIPELPDPPVDPALTAPSQWCGHGVFVCALCGAAHKLLPHTVTTVKAVHDPTAWSEREVQYLAQAGGNARAARVLEAYVPSATVHRPTWTSGIAERLTYIRAKYEALAFCLPPAVGPLAHAAWQAIVEVHHPEWQGLWGVDDLALLPSLSGLELRGLDYGVGESGSGSPHVQTMVQQHQQQQQAPGGRTAELPNRLVDYFCVVTASEFLHPSPQDLSQAQSPEDILLAPQVSDCFPEPNMDGDWDDAASMGSNGTIPPSFPDHVSTFVFPDGCRASATALPPSFFTLVLTNAAGERLYGGVLRLYDDDRDTVETLTCILDNSDYPEHLRPHWLQSQQQQSAAAAAAASATEMCATPTAKTKPPLAATPSARTMDSPASSNVGSDVIFLPKCLVILSHYPFFDLWRNFLLQIYRIALTEAPLPIERFVANFVREVPLPPPGKVQVKFGFTVADIWTIERPPENQLPLANFSYQPLFSSLSVSNVLVVIGCLLQETRVALISKHYALLTPVAEALLSLLFPFHWQGMFLPVMPYGMLDILDAPVPYLVGLHSRYLRDIPNNRRPHGVVLVDLDRDEVHLGVDDNNSTARSLPCLPERHVAKLKAKLLEFASCVYIMPDTQVVGAIKTGSGREVSPAERELYAQVSSSEFPSDSTSRRRDVFPSTDKAYRDNELLVPISGFLSEHGQLYQRDTQSPAIKGKRVNFPLPNFKQRRAKNSGSHIHQQHTLRPDIMESNHHIDNLLDLKEPPGFSSSEIRQAFLRFFVSLFRDYRNFLDETMFRDEDFLAGLGLSDSSIDFVRSVLQTQMFQVFTVERRENPSDPEVLFFDDSITAKMNRSKKVQLTRGGKKETRFLDDTGSMVTETYTPPPPSNWGLERGTSYQYGTFPSLDSDLFGQIRPPMVWKGVQRRSSIRMSRRMSAVIQASEKVVVERATRSLAPHRVVKRGVRNLEAALKTLSTPFAPPRRTAASSNSRRSRDSPRDASVVSDLTLPSTFDLTDDIVSSAEGMILNARRKQAILIGIIVKLQAFCRQFLVQNRERKHQRPLLPENGTPSPRADSFKLRKQHSAAVRVQSMLRGSPARRRFLRMRRAAVRLQAFHRWRIVYLAFQILISVIAKTQAVYRGYVVRKCLRRLLTVRMETYRKQIFLLWQKSNTPLSYRSKFWPLIKPVGLVRLAIAESELERLWKELKLRPPLLLEKGENGGMEVLRLGERLGVRSDRYLKCLKIGETPSSGKTLARDSKGKGNDSSSRGSERIIAERLQVYERLSQIPDTTERGGELFSNFLFPQKEKRRKVAIANILWSNYEECDRSVEVMLKLFPELRESTDMFFMLPSKKALRRFPSSNTIPSLLERSMWAHRILDDRIRRGVCEVADCSLRRVPSLTIRLECRSGSTLEAKSRLLKATMSERRISDRSVAKRVIIQEVLLGKARADNSTTLDRANAGLEGQEAGQSKGTNTSSLPGANFWEGGRGSSTNAATNIIQNGNGQTPQVFPGESFWVRQ